MRSNTKIRFKIAAEDKELVEPMTEYIQKLGVCFYDTCLQCKERPCKDKEGFYDVDECQYDLKEQFKRRWIEKLNAIQCDGRNCEFFMLCFVSAVREFFWDDEEHNEHPEVVMKIMGYMLWKYKPSRWGMINRKNQQEQKGIL